MLFSLISACASAPAAEADAVASAATATEETAVTVRNDHADGRDMIIYLEPEDRGQRQRLGVAGAGQTGTFRVVVPRGYYRLMGEHNLGTTQSDRFNLATAGLNVTWTMSTNRVTTTRR